MSKQRDKLFDGQAGLANDGTERAAIEFLVIRNRSLSWYTSKPILPSALTHWAPETTGSLLTQQPRLTLCDRRVLARRVRARLPRVTKLLRERSQALRRELALADATGMARNLGADKAVFTWVQENASCHCVTSARRISSALFAVFPGPPE